MKTENIRKLIDKQFKIKYSSFTISYFQIEKFYNLNSECFDLFFQHLSEDENNNSELEKAWLEINGGYDYSPWGDDEEMFSEHSSHEIESHVTFIMTYLKYIKSNESVTFMLHACDNENYEVHLMTVSAESISFRELK